MQRHRLRHSVLERLGKVRDILSTGSAEERKEIVRSFLSGIRIAAAAGRAMLRRYRLPRPDESVRLVAVGGIEPNRPPATEEEVVPLPQRSPSPELPREAKA